MGENVLEKMSQNIRGVAMIYLSTPTLFLSDSVSNIVVPNPRQLFSKN